MSLFDKPSKSKLKTGTRYVLDGFNPDGTGIFRAIGPQDNWIKKHVGWTFNVPSNYKVSKKKKKK